MDFAIVAGFVLSLVAVSARRRSGFDAFLNHYGHEAYELQTQTWIDNADDSNLYPFQSNPWECSDDSDPEDDDPEVGGYCCRCDDGPFGVQRDGYQPHLCSECRETAAYEARMEVGCCVCEDEFVVESDQLGPYICEWCVFGLHRNPEAWDAGNNDDDQEGDDWCPTGDGLPLDDPDTEVDPLMFNDLPEPSDAEVDRLLAEANRLSDETLGPLN